MFEAEERDKKNSGQRLKWVFNAVDLLDAVGCVNGPGARRRERVASKKALGVCHISREL